MASVCADCWAEWEKHEVMVINELRLNFMDPRSADVLHQKLREFLGAGRRGVSTMPPPPRGLVLRFLLFALIVVGGFLALRSDAVRSQLEIEQLTATLERLRGEPLAGPVYVVVIAILLALGFPATVLVFAGGAVFGALYGGVLAYLGTLGGAILSFVLARTLARDLVVHLLGKRLAPLEALLERHGFWALFRMRYVPVPFAVTNYGASLAGAALHDLPLVDGGRAGAGHLPLHLLRRQPAERRRRRARRCPAQPAVRDARHPGALVPAAADHRLAA